jgi:hypothetical protein
MVYWKMWGLAVLLCFASAGCDEESGDETSAAADEFGGWTAVVGESVQKALTAEIATLRFQSTAVRSEVVEKLLEEAQRSCPAVLHGLGGKKGKEVGDGYLLFRAKGSLPDYAFGRRPQKHDAEKGSSRSVYFLRLFKDKKKGYSAEVYAEERSRFNLKTSWQSERKGRRNEGYEFSLSQTLPDPVGPHFVRQVVAKVTPCPVRKEVGK